ncbi:MAG: hypothetical protein AAGA58_11600 [Verrucomicrobiota bacterium]
MAYDLNAAFDLLQTAHGQQRLAHAYLISGPEKSGKAALALKLVHLLGASEAEEEGDLDNVQSEAVRVLRPESKSRRIKIDQIRELEHGLHMTARRKGQWKIAIITDAERMMPQAQNAFLKTLEEPPEDCLLLLLTTAPEELLETIRSRCLRVVLKGNGTAAHLQSPDAKELLTALDSHFRDGGNGIAPALAFARAFGDRLKEIKKRLEKEAETEVKAEAKELKNRIEGDYLDRREKESEASAQSAYLRERARLIDVIISWFGDAVRQQNGHARLDLPEFAPTTARLGQEMGKSELLRRLDAVEGLRDLISTNVQENLALESAMIRAFA